MHFRFESKGEEKLSKESDIALKIGEVINKYKVKKYFNLKIEKNSFSYTKDQETIKEEKGLDGIYVIRTSLNKEEMKKEKVVRSYKDLSEVEIAFRSLKTEEDLEKIQIKIGEEKLSKESDIALKIGEVINKYKVKKYFNLKIEKNSFSYTKDQETIKEEKDLDGIYVIRTSLNKEEMKKEKVVRSYKDLSEVEIAFRSLKTEDLHIRPIYHYNADRVKAHIFLCMLSYYVTWHMKEILKPFLFADEELEKNKASSNPVKVVKRSDKAKQKDSMRVNRVDGEAIPVRKWPALLENLSTIQRNECRYKDFSKKRASFFLDTKKSSYQEKVFQHLKKISLPER